MKNETTHDPKRWAGIQDHVHVVRELPRADPNAIHHRRAHLHERFETLMIAGNGKPDRELLAVLLDDVEAFAHVKDDDGSHYGGVGPLLGQIRLRLTAYQ